MNPICLAKPLNFKLAKTEPGKKPTYVQTASKTIRIISTKEITIRNPYSKETDSVSAICTAVIEIKTILCVPPKSHAIGGSSVGLN